MSLRQRAEFRPLTVSAIRPLTDEAVEVTFEVPAEWADDYLYAPGQYVALRATIDGEEVRRSYSLCQAPVPGELKIGIKRDRGGRFSTWATTVLQPGDTIEVMNPRGAFTSRHHLASMNDPEQTAAEQIAANPSAHIVCIAAGSGITPIMAIVSALLRGSETLTVDLVYANRGTGDVMFAEELGDLKDKFPSRFALHHVLSREQRSNPLMSGRIDAPKLEVLLDRLVGLHADEWFLCGPFELVQLARDTLNDKGVDADRVRFELFTTGTPQNPVGEQGRPVEADPDGESVAITFTLDGTQTTVESPVAARETVLNAALRSRPDVPFACAGGVCGTCRAKVVSGNFTMAENFALEKSEVEAGYVLTCQTRPDGQELTVTFDA